MIKQKKEISKLNEIISIVVKILYFCLFLFIFLKNYK
jgi:hypothetical protein